MKFAQSLFPTALTLAALTAGVWAQTSDTASAGASAQSSGSVSATSSLSSDADVRSELEQLKQLVREQQKRIDENLEKI